MDYLEREASALREKLRKQSNYPNAVAYQSDVSKLQNYEQMIKESKERMAKAMAEADVQEKKNQTNNNLSQVSKITQNYSNSCAAINKNGCTLDPSTITNIATVAAAKAGSIVSTGTDIAANALSKLTDGLSASDSDNITPEWMSKLGSSIGDTASQFADTIADKASGAATYLSGMVDKYGGSLISTAGNALSTATNMVNKVSGLAQESANWFNGLTTSFTEKSSNKKSDVNSGFVASSNKKGVDNTKLPVSELGANLTSLKNKAFDKFAELAGPVTNLKDAVANVKKSVTCTVQSAFKAGQAVVGTIQNTVQSVTSPITSAIKTARNIANPNNVQAMVTGALDFLPDGVTNMIGKIAYNETAKYNNKLAAVQSKLNGITNLGTKVSGLLQYTEGSPELLNDAGQLLIGLATGDISKKDLDQLYKAATSYCENVAAPSYMEFGNNKLVYETLIKQALSSGSSHLLSQLANCQKYFSKETKLNIASEFFNVAKKGDVVSVETMVQATGTNMVQDAKQLARTLGTNLIKENSNVKAVDERAGAVTYSGDNEIDDVNQYYRDMYLSVVDTLNLTPDELLQDDNLPGSYSAEYVTLYARQPELLKAMGMSDTKRNTIINVYTKYALK